MLRGGQVVEAGPASAVLTSPQHEYTRSLLAAQPAPGAAAAERPVRISTAGLTARHGRTAVRLRGLCPASARAAALATLAEVGLPEHTARRRPNGLSGGELHRAALARALLAEPRVLICDEITSGLDTVTRAGILDQLAELRHRHDLTLLLISHDLDVVARIADRVVVLDHGQVVEQGAAATVLRTPRHQLTRRLLTEPPT